MSSLHQITLQSAIDKADTLVSLPAVALEVVRVTGDEDCSLEDLERVISRDPVLAGKLLKLANSTAFNLGSDVVTLPHAAMVLGLRSVKLMALSFALVDSLPRGGSDFDFEAYWRRSSVFASAARAVAQCRGQQAQVQEAFLCGLLAQLGQLVLALAFPEEYARVETCDGWPVLSAERAVFGFDSSEVASRMLADWGLPKTIGMAVAYANHDESLPDGSSDVLAGLVETLRIAGSVTKVLCSVDPGVALECLYTRAEPAMNLGRREVDVFLIGLEQDVSETLALLDLNLASSPSHTHLVEEALERLLELSFEMESDLEDTGRQLELLEAQNLRLQQAVSQDDLTDLPNREAFDERLDCEVQLLRSTMTGSLGLLVLDGDHFEGLNATYGHAAGDDVLCAIATTLRQIVRAGDFAARYDGDRFVVVLPGITTGTLRLLANRLQVEIRAIEVAACGRSLKTQVSVGGACAAAATLDAQRLLDAAVANLDEAKRLGRNRVVVSKVRS